MPDRPGTLSRGLLAGALSLALAACQPQERPAPSAPETVETAEAVVPPAPPPAPPPEPVFLPDRTYAVLEIDAAVPAWIYALCDVTVLRRYRLRYNRQNLPTCSSRELLIGVARAGDQSPGAGAVLGDGRRVLIWEVFDLAAGDSAAPLPGRYALAALSREADTIEVLTGRVPVYRITPGRIHYLGRADADGTILARDADAFARAFRARFPELARTRIDTSPLEGLDVRCDTGPGSTETRITGFNCIGKRINNLRFE